MRQKIAKDSANGKCWGMVGVTRFELATSTSRT